MTNLNSILLEGNLTRDPELRYTPKGTPVCVLQVASTRTYRLGDEKVSETSTFEGVTYGKLASVCAEHLETGRGVRLVGRLKQERVVDGDSTPGTKVLIVAEHVEFQPQRRAPAPAADTAAVAS
jgi:single-strand DNA-binding protein